VWFFNLPSDAPHSFECTDNRVVWEINTHMDIPLGPDWDDTHKLEVSPDYSELNGAPQDLLAPPQDEPEGPAW